MSSQAATAAALAAAAEKEGLLDDDEEGEGEGKEKCEKSDQLRSHPSIPGAPVTPENEGQSLLQSQKSNAGTGLNSRTSSGRQQQQQQQQGGEEQQQAPSSPRRGTVEYNTLQVGLGFLPRSQLAFASYSAPCGSWIMLLPRIMPTISDGYGPEPCFEASSAVVDALHSQVAQEAAAALPKRKVALIPCDPRLLTSAGVHALVPGLQVSRHAKLEAS
jgi:hypothetical protein